MGVLFIVSLLFIHFFKNFLFFCCCCWTGRWTIWIFMCTVSTTLARIASRVSTSAPTPSSSSCSSWLTSSKSRSDSRNSQQKKKELNNELELTHRLHGRLVATYESASTRRFRHGRVDCIRAASLDALRWVQTFTDPNSSVNQQQQKNRWSYQPNNTITNNITNWRK